MLAADVLTRRGAPGDPVLRRASTSRRELRDVARVGGARGGGSTLSFLVRRALPRDGQRRSHRPCLGARHRSRSGCSPARGARARRRVLSRRAFRRHGQRGRYGVGGPLRSCARIETRSAGRSRASRSPHDGGDPRRSRPQPAGVDIRCDAPVTCSRACARMFAHGVGGFQNAPEGANSRRSAGPRAPVWSRHEGCSRSARSGEKNTLAERAAEP